MVKSDIRIAGSVVLLLVIAPAFAENAEQTVVHPQEIDDVLRNPGMGWVYYDYGATPHVYDFPEAAYVMHSRMWADMEPVEGERKWDELRDRILYWAKRGKKSMVRIMNAYPGTEYATPKWVFDAGAESRRYKHEVWGGGVEPCYWDPVYKEKLRVFLDDFGKQFDGDPDLATVEIRDYGWWGEWHTNIEWPPDVKKREVLKGLIDLYFNAFKRTQLVAETAREYPYKDEEGYEKQTAIDYAIEKGAWIRRDGFGCPYMAKCEYALLNREWKRTTLVAEWGEGYRGIRDGKFEGRTPENTVQEILDNHVSMASLGWGGEDAFKLIIEKPDLIKTAAKRMGYRFVLKEASFPAKFTAGGAFTLKQVWLNKGNALCPFKFPLMAYLADADGNAVWSGMDSGLDITPWVEGQEYPVESTFQVDGAVPPGDYSLMIALVDGEKDPVVHLAIQGDDGQQRYRLQQVTVLPPAGLKPA